MGADLASYGENTIVQEGVQLSENRQPGDMPTKLGAFSLVRSGTILYANVSAGDYFQTGHNVLVREKTVIGKHVVIGTNSVVDGNVSIGDFVKIESCCYIPTHVHIGSRVFIGPSVTMTNDRYPLKLRDAYKPDGPVIEDNVTIGAGVVILPGVIIGSGSFIAAGAVVTKNVPPGSLVKGVPGIASRLPKYLSEQNMALSWQNYI